MIDNTYYLRLLQSGGLCSRKRGDTSQNWSDVKRWHTYSDYCTPTQSISERFVHWFYASICTCSQRQPKLDSRHSAHWNLDANIHLWVHNSTLLTFSQETASAPCFCINKPYFSQDPSSFPFQRLLIKNVNYSREQLLWYLWIYAKELWIWSIIRN